MKKFLFIVLSMYACQVMAQMTPNKRYAPAYEQDCYKGDEMVEAGRSWASRPIKVKGGGKAPGIVTLTKAWNDVWKVYVVSGVLKQAANPKFTKAVDPEYDSKTIVDRKNGYMCEDSGGTDSDYMESCVWRRKNGHSLFAILMGSPTDPVIEFVCFYDYDPATETMTPEAGPADTFKPTQEYYSYSLPQKGKDFIIKEYLLDDDETYVENIYTWDGQKHIFGFKRTGKPKR